ncbi:MAG: hypothetical protein LC792_09150 [Actinobacteria bacterium]|nr:hypothetical protein [Actinomycetota bacterium]
MTEPTACPDCGRTFEGVFYLEAHRRRDHAANGHSADCRCPNCIWGIKERPANTSYDIEAPGPGQEQPVSGGLTPGGKTALVAVATAAITSLVWVSGILMVRDSSSAPAATTNRSSSSSYSTPKTCSQWNTTYHNQWDPYANSYVQVPTQTCAAYH